MLKASLFAGARREARRASKYRSFARRWRVEGWTMTSKHCMLAPSRSQIGRHLLGDPRLSPETIARVVLSAIVSQLRQRRDELTGLSPEDANHQLIAEIHRRVKAER